MRPLYRPEGVEERWQRAWEEEGLYNADPDPSRPSFVDAHPPPNVTGELHMGHALQLALGDAVVRMKRLGLVLLTLLALAGCGGGERWGGYTEEEVKRIMVTDEFRETILAAVRNPGLREAYRRMLPSEEQVEAADLRQVTIRGTGQEAWEYQNTATKFCIFVWEDEETQGYATQLGSCAFAQ